jgi:hypothetical protein
VFAIHSVATELRGLTLEVHPATVRLIVPATIDEIGGSPVIVRPRAAIYDVRSSVDVDDRIRVHEASPTTRLEARSTTYARKNGADDRDA